MTTTTTTTRRGPRGPYRSHNTPRVGTAARRMIEDQALALRNQGYTYRQIADALNTLPQQVSDYVRAAVARLNVVTRSFGVEIELKGLTTRAATIALRDAGLVAEDSGYTHSATPFWKVLLDGSVSGGCEVVSPILSGEAGLADVQRAMDALRNAGATVDTQCGLHVHVDFRDLSGDEFGRVFGFYAERQDLMDLLVAPSRRRNMYCRKYAATQIAAIKRAASEDGKEAVHYTHSDRYYTVNVTSYSRHSTMEFRQHQGTLNPTKAIAWVRMLLAIVTKVQSATEESVSRTDVNDMIDGLALPTETATYLKSRAARLGA